MPADQMANEELHRLREEQRVVSDLGFQSAPGFSNVFRKHYGMSPSEFRARSP